MHTRRLAVLLLGAWLGVSIFVAVAAIHNSRSASAILEMPLQPLQRAIDEAGRTRIEAHLKFQAAEISRAHQTGWGWAQIVLGVILTLTVVFGTNARRPAVALAAAMVLIAAVEQVAVTPRLVELGRTLAWPRQPQNSDEVEEIDIEREKLIVEAEQRALGTYQASYLGLEAVKLLSGIGLAGWFLASGGGPTVRRRRRSRHSAMAEPAAPGETAVEDAGAEGPKELT
jgi:hypothetical protein